MRTISSGDVVSCQFGNKSDNCGDAGKIQEVVVLATQSGFCQTFLVLTQDGKKIGHATLSRGSDDEVDGKLVRLAPTSVLVCTNARSLDLTATKGTRTNAFAAMDLASAVQSLGHKLSIDVEWRALAKAA